METHSAVLGILGMVLSTLLISGLGHFRPRAAALGHHFPSVLGVVAITSELAAHTNDDDRLGSPRICVGHVANSMNIASQGFDKEVNLGAIL